MNVVSTQPVASGSRHPQRQRGTLEVFSKSGRETFAFGQRGRGQAQRETKAKVELGVRTFYLGSKSLRTSRNRNILRTLRTKTEALERVSLRRIYSA